MLKTMNLIALCADFLTGSGRFGLQNGFWGPAISDALHRARLPARDAAAIHASIALTQQHGNQILRAAVAKELPFVFFMKCNALLLHERREILRRIARERTAAKAWIV